MSNKESAKAFGNRSRSGSSGEDAVIRTAPQVMADRRQRITEGRFGLGIPRRLPNRQLMGVAKMAMSATRLKMPHRHGVVRSIARSDHWRWVSKPNRARNSSKVISIFQRAINSWMMRSALSVGSEQKSPVGLNCSFFGVSTGQRTKTQRRGAGSWPR